MKPVMAIASVTIAFIAGAAAMRLMSTAYGQSAAANGPGAGGIEELRSGLPAGKFPALGKRLWLIEATPTGDGSRQREFIQAHLAHQIDLEKRDIMFGAGPAKEVDGDSRFGLISIRADSAEEARRIADSDPMHINKARTYKLYEWMLNEGTLDIRVNFSQGTFKLD